jgi:hypothetical protein
VKKGQEKSAKDAGPNMQHSARSAAVPLPSDGRPQVPQATVLLRQRSHATACAGFVLQCFSTASLQQHNTNSVRKGVWDLSINCYYFALFLDCGIFSTFVRFQMVIETHDVTHRQKALKKCINFAI